MPKRFGTREVIKRYLELNKDFDISDDIRMGRLLLMLERKGYDSKMGKQRGIFHLDTIRDEYYGLHPGRRKYISPK